MTLPGLKKKKGKKKRGEGWWEMMGFLGIYSSVVLERCLLAKSSWSWTDGGGFFTFTFKRLQWTSFTSLFFLSCGGGGGLIFDLIPMFI